MKIFDAFSYFNEESLLEIRLEIMNPFVDKFVLVEATKTYSGQDKELNFQLNKHKFAKFLHKIEHVVVDTYPDAIVNGRFDPWVYENHQRRCIDIGLKRAGVQDEDMVILSDLDEIPDPKRMAEYIDAVNNSQEHCAGLQQRLFYYYLNVMYPMHFVTALFNTKVVKYGALKNIGDLQTLRLKQCQKTILDAGWHFSFLGGIEKVKYKIESFAHQEFNRPDIVDLNALHRRIENNEDVLGRGERFVTVSIDESFPEYIQKNQLRYSHLIRK